MPDPGASEPRQVRAAEGKVRAILRAGEGRESPLLPESAQDLREVQEYEASRQQLEAAQQEIDLKGLFARQEYELRRSYARGILWLLSIELLIANAVFVAFAWAGEEWKLATAVIDVWLGATVVQVVGIVLVVTRHLFPDRNLRSGAGSASSF